MKIYLFPLLLGLALDIVINEIPLGGSVCEPSNEYFYINISSLTIDETIKLKVSFRCDSSGGGNFELKYRRSNYYDEAEFSKVFIKLNYYDYTKDPFDLFPNIWDYDFYFSLSKDSYSYDYILLKTKLEYPVYVTFYYDVSNDVSNLSNYTWIILIILLLIAIEIVILVICIIICARKKSKTIPGVIIQPAVNYNQPPVNAYQPPVHQSEPQQMQHVQPS